MIPCASDDGGHGHGAFRRGLVALVLFVALVGSRQAELCGAHHRPTGPW
jgi:MYXO-CTERM domain-containing protein